ncbi:MAG TPA: hypothetical protein VLJ60_11345 [bacterium]|nr:hypothetical protein [bacterium]
MLKKTITCLFIVLGVFSTVSSKELGPDVSVYRGEELKWEDYQKGYNYQVMFRSLLADEETCYSERFVEFDHLGYYLGPDSIPDDAYIERAFLIWTGSQPIDKIDEPADNQVILKFKSFGYDYEIKKMIQADSYKVTEPKGFEFDSYVDPDGSGKAYYTYRVDITDFFDEMSGTSLHGGYYVSGLKCVNAPEYSENGDIVAGWAIILVYSTNWTAPNAVYIYDGFKSYKDETTETVFSGFEFTEYPKTKLTLLSHGGKPDIHKKNPVISEVLAVQGSGQKDWIYLSNACNPEMKEHEIKSGISPVDVFNSISSIYGWEEGTSPYCMGGNPREPELDKVEHSLDVDTFLIDFNKNTNEIKLKIGSYDNRIITNTLIISTDLANPRPDFNIPLHPEMIACTPADTPFNPYSLNGNWCYGDLEYTFMIILQNFGETASPPVSVNAEIPQFMEYVPNSTEYANKFKVVNGKLNGEEWFSITDSENNGFPLINSTQVAEKIIPNEDTVFVRFRTKVKDTTPKNEVFELTAMINAEGYSSFPTNMGYPVKLVYSYEGCVEKQEDVDLSECGGIPETTDEQPDTDSDSVTDDDAKISEKDNSFACNVLII